MNNEDIIVTVAHNWGETDVTLAHWIANGPGPRWKVQPVAARDRVTGAQLPLRVIPLRYRNSALSRLLVRLGVLKMPPWKHVRY